MEHVVFLKTNDMSLPVVSLGLLWQHWAGYVMNRLVECVMNLDSVDTSYALILFRRCHLEAEGQPEKPSALILLYKGIANVTK